MNRFIPREKMSKKEKRKLDRTQRQTWVISPVSRTIKSKKVYDRKKARRWSDDGTGLSLVRHCPLIKRRSSATPLWIDFDTAATLTISARAICDMLQPRKKCAYILRRCFCGSCCKATNSST